MPLNLDEVYDESQLDRFDACAAKHGLTLDEYLMKLSDGAEQVYQAEQPKRGGVVLPFRRRNS